jgi:hypothetical protein
VASLSPYYKDSHTIAQDMFTVHLSLSIPDYKTLPKFRMGKYSIRELLDLMNEFHNNTKIEL